MSWTTVLIACFLVSQGAAVAMLVTSGMFSELFGRHRRIARAHDSSRLLRRAGASEWVENHEFWEMSEPEHVAF